MSETRSGWAQRRAERKAAKAEKNAARWQAMRDKKVQELEAYRAVVERHAADLLDSGERIYAAISAYRGGTKTSSGGGLESVLSNVVDAPGNRRRKEQLQDSAASVGFPADIGRMVLAATDRRLLVFFGSSERRPDDYRDLPQYLFHPGDLATEFPYGQLIGAQAREQTLEGNATVSGVVNLVFADGRSHAVASNVSRVLYTDESGPLLTFAAAVTQLANSRRGGGGG